MHEWEPGNEARLLHTCMSGSLGMRLSYSIHACVGCMLPNCSLVPRLGRACSQIVRSHVESSYSDNFISSSHILPNMVCVLLIVLQNRKSVCTAGHKGSCVFIRCRNYFYWRCVCVSFSGEVCVTDSMTTSNVSEKASWFVGKMERGQAEQFLMEVRREGGELNYHDWDHATAIKVDLPSS